MKWSLKLVRIADIDIYVHATFYILLLWIGLSYWVESGSLRSVISGLGFILAIFASVVLHELGHALTARRFNIRTLKITLFPIGGVASMERMPDKPEQEMAVALAGPAVNLGIAVTIWLWLLLTGSMPAFNELSLTGGVFLEKFMAVNLVLALFNMLPAFPMDGGRVLRASLSFKMDHYQATQTAARIGQGLALWLGFFGLLYNPFLIFIALFVWIGAAAEAGMEQIKTTLSRVSLGQAMLTDFRSLEFDDPLSRAIELTLAGSQKEFPVLRDAEFVGVLTQDELLNGLQLEGVHSNVGRWMQQEIEKAYINESVNDVMERLQISNCPLLLVIDEGQPVGIINLDNIMEMIKIQDALQGQY